METEKNIESWLKGEYDAASKEEILRLQKENPKELFDAFYRHLDFGTGGLRGIMGVGTNRMNVYTIRIATQGLANYLLKQTNGAQPSVFIGFDCRHHSHTFAIEAARVLTANKIHDFLYKELRPVANVSFGVLKYHCTAGIMITASHNPPQYNGYKVYASYGGQVLPPHDQGIIEEVKRISSLSLVKIADFPNSLIKEVSTEIDEAYLHAISPCQMHVDDNRAYGKNLKVVYTNLHGSGITMIPSILRAWGFTQLSLVEEQKVPDGNFPTVQSPNPEERSAMSLGIEKLMAMQGDILLGTDPDTDRLGVVVMHEEQPFFFDGNQVACLLIEHLCLALHKQHALPSKPMSVKTIVTTELFKQISESYGVKCLDTLTGFKYIGEKIHQWEEESWTHQDTRHFLMGAEESYGYLIGTHVRDKDAIITSASICEAALQMKLQKKTLVDLLYEIYLKYGVYREKLLSIVFEGKEGAEQMLQMMIQLRDNPPKKIADKKIEIFEDYATGICHDFTSHSHIPLKLPKSDVLRFWLEDQTKIVIRPSGTEPKIKIYCGVKEKIHHSNQQMIKAAIASCDSRLDFVLQEVKNFLSWE